MHMLGGYGSVGYGGRETALEIAKILYASEEILLRCFNILINSSGANLSR